MPKTNIVFSASSYDLWQFCPTKYDLSHLRRKALPTQQKPKPLDRGTIIHKAMEVYFNQLAEGVHFNDRVHNMLMKAKESAANVADSNIDITEELPIITDALAHSCEFWRFEDEHLEILTVETPFDYILYEDDYVRIIISGKVDLLVNKPAMMGAAAYTNLPYDHKSTERNYPVDELNNQFQNYCVAAKSNYIIVNKIGLQKTLKPEEKFLRIPLSYDTEMLEEWKRDVVEDIVEHYLPAFVKNSFPKRRINCRKFNRLCEFYPVCKTSGQDSKKWKLETLYIDREPWDKYAEEDQEGAV